MTASRSRRSASATRFFRWFGAIWLLMGLPFLIAGLFLLHRERTFQRESRVTAGVLIEKDSADTTRRRRSGGRSRRVTTTKYYVEYRFVTPEGREIHARRDIDDSRWDGLEKGQRVEIAYLPSDPGTNRLAGDDDWMLPLVFTLLGLVFSGAGSTIFLKARASERAAARLRERGVMAGAVINRVEDASIKINKQPQARVVYEYRDYQGHAHEGRSRLLPASEASAWHAGQPISIKYDPERPSHSIWLEEQDSAAAAEERRDG